MRDLIVVGIVFGSLPLILWKPYIGVLMWVWIGVMNPHRLTYGFAANYPFAMIIAVVTLLSLVIRPVPRRLPMTGVTVVLIAFVVWMNVTTLFAMPPDSGFTQWSMVMKVMSMTFITMTFAMIIAVVTLLSPVIRPVPRRMPMTGVTVVLIAYVVLIVFVVWMNVTTLFAMLPDPGFIQIQWSRVMKVMLMTFMAMILIRERGQIQQLVWALVISLGFYGVKGGIFTILSGGTYMVWGPSATFISDNNEIALALVMTIPLMRYLQTITRRKLVRHGLSVAMILSSFAALGTYSRGALLAMAVMATLLAMKSRRKLQIALLVLVGLPLMIGFMPDKWTSRMNTIHTYEQDASAMGRINAWWMTYNLAKDRPLVGGGFDIYRPEFFMAYAPDPNDIHVAHSIYFQALGEHGFVGLGLYLLLAFLTLRNGRWIIRHTNGMEQYKWAHDLAAMIQVSLIGFAIGGAFLSLLYFDVPYYLMAAMVATRALIEKEIRQAGSQDSRRSARTTPKPDCRAIADC